MINLKPLEREILIAINHAEHPIDWRYPFRAIEQLLEFARDDRVLPSRPPATVDRASIRLACRRMKRAGLLEYSRGLLSEEGELAGAGYGLTITGAVEADKLTSNEKESA